MKSVVFFEHINYQGRSWSFDGDQAFVGGDANDQFSSVKVPAGVTVQLFQHRDFGGTSVTLTADTPDLRTVGFNDGASSVKYSGGGSGGEKTERLKKGDKYVECGASGLVTLTTVKRDDGKVKVTRHDDEHYDATFTSANRILTIDPDGSLTSRAAGDYGLWQQLSATTQPKPKVVNLLYRVQDGVVIGGTVLQIVEE